MPAIEVVRANPDVPCDEPGCRDAAVVWIDCRGGENAGLCREHARAHARAVLSIVHHVDHREPTPLPASQRGFVG